MSDTTPKLDSANPLASLVRMDRTADYGAVTDWASDFDLVEPDYVARPEIRWAEQRQHCPIAFTERRQRSWLPVRYEDLVAIAHDVEHFSSHDPLVVSPFDMTINDLLPVPPISSDPPVHTWARRLLLPAFGPSTVEAMSAVTGDLAKGLIAEHFSDGHGDAAADYARHIPVRVIAKMLGVPLEDEETFTGWVVRTLQEGFQGADFVGGALDAMMEMTLYFAAKLAERRKMAPGTRPQDLITMLIEAETPEPMSDQHVLGSCFLLLIAGIDTTWSAIGSSIWHLATHPDDQQCLRDDPSIIPSAVEEFLRFYSPVTMARIVKSDVDFNGCPMREGDKIVMAFPAGNRDPAQFEDADKFIIDRQKNRHFAFGSGIHRCLGSNLARMEVRVAVETFLDLVPPFELADPDAVVWTAGQVRGPRCIPVRPRVR